MSKFIFKQICPVTLADIVRDDADTTVSSFHASTLEEMYEKFDDFLSGCGFQVEKDLEEGCPRCGRDDEPMGTDIDETPFAFDTYKCPRCGGVADRGVSRDEVPVAYICNACEAYDALCDARTSFDTDAVNRACILLRDRGCSSFKDLTFTVTHADIPVGDAAEDDGWYTVYPKAEVKLPGKPYGG